MNISGSCGESTQKTQTQFIHQKDQKQVDNFKIVVLFLCSEILFLFLPYCFWSSIDKQQAIRKIGLEVAKMDNTEVKITHLSNFVIKYLNGHGSYVKMFLFTELLNLVFSLMPFSFLFFYWEIRPTDIANFFLSGKCGQIAELFPLQTGCTFEQNSIVPGLGNDFYETACFLRMNEVYGYIVTGLYVWLSILLVLGMANFGIRIMQYTVKPFRAFCLKQSAGHFSLNVNNELLVQVLTFSDFFVLDNMSRHVESDVFSALCTSLLEELSPSVPEIEKSTSFL